MITNVINLECSTTMKGKRLLLFGGYTYMLNKDRGKVKYWRYRDWSCAGFVHTDDKDNYKAHYGSRDGYLPSPEQIQETRQRTRTHILAFRQNNFGQLFVDRIPIRQNDCRLKFVDQNSSTKFCRQMI